MSGTLRFRHGRFPLRFYYSLFPPFFLFYDFRMKHGKRNDDPQISPRVYVLVPFGMIFQEEKAERAKITPLGFGVKFQALSSSL